MGKVIVNMSGGKDSTALALMMLERGEPVDEFIYCDTGFDFPECYETIAKFEQDTGRKVTRLKAELSFEHYMVEKPTKQRNPDKPRADGRPRRKAGYGWPNILRRWCTKYFKTNVADRYLREKYGKGGYVRCIGIAADEPRRIRDGGRRYPLAEWGVTEADCLAYCRARGYYASPCAYDFCSRMSCFICPLQNLKQVEYMVTQRPELWAEIKRLEERVGEPWKDRGTAYYEERFGGQNETGN